ncbi:RES domain-containing protein [Leekyejoonella antrihumi]|uniref:RES domain-containing protein n=1 Tax=Leekyejoonella antrihumi TaxID=1660198 RepID=A0A563DSP2_9MICO|nr:RES domain-containing protein [Leekyejoonella antrihumi]TWP33189.1 RES domain-containing protein [Leekyejoonella antrihumi]
MSVPDLEITGDPGTVWRVGFEPDPWAWTSWIYATDSGLFDGRWDDQLGVFRTLYTSASLVGCFLELLAKHRPDTVLQEALAEIDDPGNLAADDREAPPGAIGSDWLEGRQFGRATQVGRYCFITHSRTIAAIDAAGQFAAHGIPSRDVDAALLKNAEDRVLTRSVARWVYDLRDDERNELVDGVEFRSRLGDEIRMWAVFERSPDETKRHSNLITPEWNAPVTPQTPELVDAFSRLGLFWHELE